jgi:hypothetical protein
MKTLEYLLEHYNPEKLPKAVVHNSRAGTLLKIFKRLGFTVGAEIGVANGYFSKAIKQYVPNVRLYCVDAWQLWDGCTKGETQETFDRQYRSARKRLIPFNCEFVREWSQDAVKRFEDESLDFVYIDAAHDYDAVLADITEWTKKVRKGGIVSGHDYMSPKEILVKAPEYTSADYNDVNYGSKRAVDEYVKTHGVKHLFVFDKDFAASWFFIKI